MMKKASLILFIFIALNASCQQTNTHFTPEYFEKQQFAHRGGYANGPENTLETILFNLSHGVNNVEIDIQLTKDSQLVLFHDKTIERILDTESKTKVTDMTLEQLKKYPLKDRGQGKQYVCSFKELIDTLVILIPQNPDLHFILELDFKPTGEYAKIAVDQLLTLLEFHKNTFGDQLYDYFFLSTFYPGVLKYVREKDKKMKTSFAVINNPKKSKVSSRLAIILAPYFIKKYNIDIIEPNICMVTKRFVKKWHKKGILINAYTANTKHEKQHMELYQIAYITNCPSSYCPVEEADELGKPKKWCKKCKQHNL